MNNEGAVLRKDWQNMETMIHILHLEDDPIDAELIHAKVEETNLTCRITLVQDRDEYVQALQQDIHEIILADFKLPGYDGMSALRLAKELRPDVPFIFVSGTMGEEAAIEGLTQGATDYVLKHDLSRLPPAVNRALDEARNRRRRRNAERALVQSENKMRGIMENIGVGVVLISPKMEILEMNRRMSQWFPGVDPGQHPICYQSFNSPPGQDVCSYCPSVKTFEDGLVHEATTQTPKDGSIRNYRVVSSPLYNTDGEVIAAIEMVDDITEHLRDEKVIQETNEMLRAIIEAAPVAIVGLDLNGCVHSVWNPAAEKMLGWSAHEVMGRSLPTVSKDKQGEFRGFREQIRKGMTLDGVEVRRQRRDGTPIDYSIYASPLHDDQGRVNGNIAVLVDITERKRAQIRMNEQLLFLQQLLDSIPIPVYYKDAQGLYLGCNTAFETFTGTPREDIVGRTVHEVVPRERADKHHVMEMELLSNPGVQEYELGYKGRDGKHHDVIYHRATFLDTQKQVAGSVGAMVDITERKQAERERLANFKFFESMDRVNQAIQGAGDLEKMMKDLLDVVLSIFDCDRAFLMYPCDPNAQAWFCPMESHRQDYPGILELKHKTPMDPQVAQTLRIILASDGPVAFGPGTSNELPDTVSEEFGIKSYLSMAVYPRADNPWQFGIHQCTHARDWTAEEMKLFEAIGRRLADSLSNLLSYRDLRESKEFLDNIVEHIPNMIFVKDARTLRFVRFNKAGEQLVGYPREDLVGKTDHDFFPKEMADSFASKDRQVLESKKPLDISEETIIDRSSEMRILHTKKIPLLDDTGVPQYVLGISEDITERKKSEESIRKLSEAVEQSPVSIVITDVTGKIEFVNAKFTHLTGYSFAEAIGRNPSILKSGETPPDEYRRLWQTIRAGGIWQGEFQNRKKDGELFWEQATIAPIRNADHAITHYVAVKEDITERKKLDEQLRQVQKMEAIGQLAGGIAHDFNNILSAITGYTELSMSTLEPESQTFEYLSQVMEASGRAKDLINQILMFSRETDQEIRPIRIAFPVNEALKLIRASVPAFIEIRSEILSSAYAMADPTQVHQIVMNLCTNAAHAMKEKGGLLSVQLTSITVSHTDKHQDYPDAKPGEYIRLAVSDEGYGIDAQYIHRIFDPFFTTKKRGEGTGMGLSVVHGIVKSYGGYIYARNRSAKGSTFEILIPAQKAGAVHDAILEKPAPTGSESILFVDDEIMIVDIIERMLESLGYHVVSRTSAIEALEAFKKNPDKFDLVVTDMVMPKMSGLELAEKILRIRPDFPIVLCTGFDAAMSEAKIAEHGLKDVIFKPILRRDMATIIRKTLDRG